MNNKEKSPVWFYPVCILLVALIAVFVAVGVNSVNPQTEPISEASTPVEEPTQTPKPMPDIPPAAEENDLLAIATKAQGSEEKICYLTFDDGPTKEVTPAVLDVLKEKDVKATFFLLGKMITANGEIAKRAHKEGHLLANHTYSHVYKELYASGESFMAEINKTHALIREITGEEPFRLIRFPGGGQNNGGSYCEEKQQYKLLLKQHGYYFADWNALNGDAEASGTRTVSELLNRMRQTSGPKNIVVLMHDAATKKTTAEALPAMIDQLRGEGYVFKRLDEIKYYGGENVKTAPDMTL